MHLRPLPNVFPALAALAVLTGSPMGRAQAATPAAAIMAGGNASLLVPEGGGGVPPAASRDTAGRFFATYQKLGQPRLLFVVNREAAAEGAAASGARRGHQRGERTREARAAGGLVASFAASQPAVAVAAPAPGWPLGDVARQFDQPFREGGARLADPTAVATLMAGKPLTHFTAAGSEAARRDRAALAQVADVIVEVVVAQREVVLPIGAAARVGWQPEVQATAFRLSDSAIIGQANSRDLLHRRRGETRGAGAAESVEALTQATALALMASIARGAAQ